MIGGRIDRIEKLPDRILLLVAPNYEGDMHERPRTIAIQPTNTTIKPGDTCWWQSDLLMLHRTFVNGSFHTTYQFRLRRHSGGWS